MVYVAGMSARKAHGLSVDGLIAAAVRGELEASQVLSLCRECPEVVALALLTAGRRIAEQEGRLAEQVAQLAARQELAEDERAGLSAAGLSAADLTAAGLPAGDLAAAAVSPATSVSTPSGMVPIYTKPNTPRRRKRPGAKKGQPGRRRAKPVESIDGVLIV